MVLKEILMSNLKKVNLSAVRIIAIKNREEFHITVSSQSLLNVLSFLKLSLGTQYTTLIDLVVMDLMDQQMRFRVTYVLLSSHFNARCYVHVYVAATMELCSITSLYDAAVWLERQAWDIFGLFFNGHPDLRRMLTDYGFKGHPMRKDFPLVGYDELRFSENENRVVAEKVELTQEFRFFDFRK